MIGPRMIEKYGFKRQTGNYYEGYKQELNITTFTEFNLYMPGVLPSMYSETYDMMDEVGVPKKEKFTLQDVYEHSQILKNDQSAFLESMISSSLVMPSMSLPEFYKTEHKNDYNTPLRRGNKIKIASGYDAIYTVLHQERERAIKGYCDYIELFGDKRPRTWTDCIDFGYLDSESVDTLSRIYDQPCSASFFVVAMFEKAERQAVFGRSMSNIIARQFQLLRDGDSMFFENKDVFTKEQLAVIRSVKMSDIICSVANCRFVQDYAFVQAIEPFNSKSYSCSKRSSFNVQVFGNTRITQKVARSITEPSCSRPRFDTCREKRRTFDYGNDC